MVSAWTSDRKNISLKADLLKVGPKTIKGFQMILNGEIPLSIGGGIGQSRVQMLLLRKAHLGEVSITVWPQELHDICEQRNIRVLR